MRAGEAFSTVGMVCDGQRRSRRVVKGSPDAGWGSELALPPLRELTKFWTRAETSLAGAAL
jgi:hypothetical protein